MQKKGFNYRILLNWFETHPLTPTLDLAKHIPLLYGGSVGAGAGHKYSSYYDIKATMATWNTDELKFVKNALVGLGQYLVQWIESAKTSLEKVEKQTEIQELIGKTLRLGGVSNDLYYFLLVLQAWARDKQQSVELVNLIGVAIDGVNRSVMASYLGKGYQKDLMLLSKGVAVWLPNSEAEYNEMLPQFRQSLFYQSLDRQETLSPWGKFIELLY